MDRKQKRRYVRETMKENDDKMVEVEKSEWVLKQYEYELRNMTRLFRSKKRIALVFDDDTTIDGRHAIRVMCRDIQSNKLGWSDLQKIKNECFGDEACGIQYLPPESMLVDKANMYWFYIVK